MRGTGNPSGGNVLLGLAGAVVFLGAGWFGLASCGGYAWHKTVFYGSASIATGAALLLPSPLLKTLGRKAVFLSVLVGGHFLIEAGVAPFYPGLPASLMDYFQLLQSSLIGGPCG